MTREEAIKFAEHAVNMTDIPEVKEFYRMAAAALTPPTQEQVENVWRGEWEEERFNGELEGWQHRECGRHSKEKSMFCPKCGAPMTNEAVGMVMERLEAMNDEGD